MARLYTYSEAADELRCSVSYLKKGVRERTIPFRRLGKLVRFSESDLNEIANRGAFTPVRPRQGRR
jgi:excisionase family DNA binding protein